MEKDDLSRQYEFHDRRRYPRSSIDCMLSVQRLGASGGLAHVSDMSAGGVRFQCVGFNMALEEVVEIQFTLGKAAFGLFGKTVRTAKLDEFAQEVALAFTGMDPEIHESLHRNLYGVPEMGSST
jgi:hypothetical protein